MYTLAVSASCRVMSFFRAHVHDSVDPERTAPLRCHSTLFVSKRCFLLPFSRMSGYACSSAFGFACDNDLFIIGVGGNGQATSYDLNVVHVALTVAVSHLLCLMHL